jgi:hypothetical protein
LARLRNRRLSIIEIHLEAVLDCCDTGTVDPDCDGEECCDLTKLGLVHKDLCKDADEEGEEDECYSVPRALGQAARRLGVEGMLVPSATKLGNNLIVFEENLGGNSRLELIGHIDPKLYAQ